MMTSAQVVETFDQSMSPQTVLLRTTLTRAITIYLIMIEYSVCHKPGVKKESEFLMEIEPMTSHTPVRRSDH